METPRHFSLCECLVNHARQRPEEPAWFLFEGDRTWVSSERRVSRSVPWGEVAGAVAGAMERLRAKGIVPGSRVLTQLQNGWSAVMTTLALELLGAIESPVDSRASNEEVLRRARVLDTGFVLSSDHWLLPADPISGVEIDRAIETIAGVRFSEPTSPLWILWTSGTTRQPHGVVLSRGGVISNATGKLEKVPQQISDRRLTVLPLAHAYARTCDFVTWLLSGCCMSAGLGWAAIESIAPEFRPTLLNAVPALIDRALMRSKENGCDGNGKLAGLARRKRLDSIGLGSLRILGCGGAALSRTSFEELCEMGIIPIQGYGLTEAGPVICSASTADYQSGCVGSPIAETHIRITETGELQSCGPGQMLEYWRDPEATKGRFTEDGWLRTGDEAMVDPNGQVRILGRVDEVLVLPTGRKVYPSDYEQQMCLIPGIRQVLLRVVDGVIEAIIDSDLVETSVVQLWHAIAQCEQSWGGWPKISQLRLYPKQMTVEGGELTVKGTVRRKSVFSRLQWVEHHEKKGRSSIELRPPR